MRIIYSLSFAALSAAFLFSPSAFATTGCNAAGWELGFYDVRGCMSAYPAIQYLVDQKIVQGYPDRTFGPERNINRAEFTKILIGVKSTEQERLECLKKTALFPDVSMHTWYAPYVCIAMQRGIISGYDDGTFRPSQYINYAEAAKVAANAYALPILPKDQDDPRWYSPYARALLEKNAVPPTVESYDASLTRSEMSELIYRLETGKTSLEWFARIPDGDAVYSEYIPGAPQDFSFSFPGSLFSAKKDSMSISDLFAIGGQRTIPAFRFTHVFQEEGCNGMAGYDAPCRPAATEMSIAVGILDRPVEYIRLGFGDTGEDMKPIIVAGRSGYTYWQGVECEGIEYTFIPYDTSRSFMMTRGYDCNDAPERERLGYLPSERQQQLLHALLDSIGFQNPPLSAHDQTAPTMPIHLLLCADESSYQDRVNDPTVRVTVMAPKTVSAADSVLRLLFRTSGSHKVSRQCDGVSSVGYYYRGVTIAGGVATVKLSKPFGEIFTEASARVYADSARRSIEANLKQFSTVKSVQFSPQ